MMRKLANEKGFTINEYNIEHLDSGKEVDHVFKEEKDIFVHHQNIKPVNH